MDLEGDELPFQVGEFVETKSFIEGYRGAWFCCKIMKISKKNLIEYDFEYIDFPGEEIECMKIYQKAPESGDMHLMVRPCFPPVYHKSTLPDLNAILDVTVVVTETWKVGDLVDWWCSGCYWSGSLSKILGHGKYTVDLLTPPLGEGSSYNACGKDLRPTLNWLPTDGWSVPVPKGSGKRRPCARLIKPVNPGRVDAPNSLQTIVSSLPSMSSSSERSEQQSEAAQAQGSCLPDSEPSCKRTKIDGEFSSDTLGLNTLEGAILDLEELVNQIKWTKHILEVGTSLTDTVRPSWKFIEHEAPHRPG